MGSRQLFHSVLFLTGAVFPDGPGAGLMLVAILPLVAIASAIRGV